MGKFVRMVELQHLQIMLAVVYVHLDILELIVKQHYHVQMDLIISHVQMEEALLVWQEIANVFVPMDSVVITVGLTQQHALM